ncbi:single-stranded DNA-binding protein [Candidatus Phytoplasma solani]|uniref:single-stranded DNA-binding protein n=1 Tax=Candidatus Phytoplasma solani TaxID=69896 RepID=UPI0003B7CB37|nr:single-stranded DNA-binding protein [Candidatus Phytoplasma solani]CCP88047.1 Single-stranded DNA-binding protein [Candidatus Phytoplasma solani]
MLNKVQFIGFITHDLKKEYIKVSNSYNNEDEILKVGFQLAINNNNKDKETLFINCVAFRTQAKNIFDFLHKGSKIYVEGKLSIQKYITKENEKKTSVIVNVSNVIFLDNKINKKDDKPTYINLTTSQIKNIKTNMK